MPDVSDEEWEEVNIMATLEDRKGTLMKCSVPTCPQDAYKRVRSRASGVIDLCRDHFDTRMVQCPSDVVEVLPQATPVPTSLWVTYPYDTPCPACSAVVSNRAVHRAWHLAMVKTESETEAEPEATVLSPVIAALERRLVLAEKEKSRFAGQQALRNVHNVTCGLWEAYADALELVRKADRGGVLE
jgi:hypothetical protein